MWIFLVMLLAAVQSRAGEKVLFDPSAYAPSALTCTGADLSAAAGQPWVTLKPVPGVAGYGLGISPASGGTWDLSAYREIQVDVRNGGTEGFVVALRLEDKPAAPDAWNCNTWWVWLDPGERWTLTQKLLRPSPSTLDLFGMRTPLALFSKDPDAADPKKLARLVLFLADVKPGQVLQVGKATATGKYQAPPAAFFPCIDSFGQYRHADWPGKTRTLADLVKKRSAEPAEWAAHPAPAGWDQYGGWAAGPSLNATGHFYTAKRGGKWWLVDPAGNLFFSQGIAVIQLWNATPYDEREKWFKDFPGKEARYKRFMVPSGHVVRGHYEGKKFSAFDFWQANLMRKYGDDDRWKERFSQATQSRLASWGINTIGNWSSPEVYLLRKTPYTVPLGNWGARRLEGSTGFWQPFYDVFDPSFARGLDASLKGQKETVEDPWCIGYFVDNELSWDEDTTLAEATLACPPAQPAKVELFADLRKKYGSVSKLDKAWGTGFKTWQEAVGNTLTPQGEGAKADLRAFNRKTAELYFKTCRQAVKKAAPHKLYLGCRFAWFNDQVVEAAAKYCDVLSYNFYRPGVGVVKLPQGVDKPVMGGEFHFGAMDRGMFDTGMVAVPDQAARARAYKNYVESALLNPMVVGIHWFEYKDQPVTGRPLDEEPAQVGFVDIADTPYPEMVKASRELAVDLYPLRSKGSR